MYVYKYIRLYCLLCTRYTIVYNIYIYIYIQCILHHSYTDKLFGRYLKYSNHYNSQQR